MRRPMRVGVQGFTLIELLIAASIMSIVLAVGITSLQGQKREGQVRSAIYRIRGVINQARSAALTLGPANNTPRITAINNCPVDFNGPGGGRAGLLINTTIGQQGLTFVERVVRNVGPNPPTFQIFCNTVSLDAELNNSVQFQAGAAEFQLPAAATPGAFFLPFSSRGFIDQLLPGPVPGVGRLVLTATEPPQRRQVILIMASGFACLEGRTPGSCARSDE